MSARTRDARVRAENGRLRTGLLWVAVGAAVPGFVDGQMVDPGPRERSAEPYAVQGGTVHTLAGPAIEGGVVVIQDGRIAAVGRDVAVPAGARVVDATGLHVYPGLFDAFSRLGLTEIGQVGVTQDLRELGKFNPHLLAVTAVHPASELIPVARANGVTHAVAAPNPVEGGMGGQASVVSLAGWTAEEMRVEESVGVVLNWPTIQTRRFSFATFSAEERSYREAREEHDEAVAEIRGWLDAARRYRAAVTAGSSRAERDLRLEALSRVVGGELPLLVEADDERDIRNAVAFADSQEVRMVLLRGRQAWKLADLLAEKEIPVILGPTQALPSGRDEAYDEPYAAPGVLHRAGVRFAFATFNASASRTLPYEAAMAVPYGLPREEALRAATVNGAEILGVSNRLGTLEPGKVANLVVVDGDPLEITTRIRHVFIDGHPMGLENKHDELYQRYRARPAARR